MLNSALHDAMVRRSQWKHPNEVAQQISSTTSSEQQEEEEEEEEEVHQDQSEQKKLAQSQEQLDSWHKVCRQADYTLFQTRILLDSTYKPTN